MSNFLSRLFFKIPSGTAFRSVSDGTNEITETAGTGSPEGVIVAKPGSRYVNYTDGSAWVKATGSGSTGWNQPDFYTHPNHTGDVDSTGDGPTVIAQEAVTSIAIPAGELSNIKLADVESGTLKGRLTLLGGPVEDLNSEQARTVLNVQSGANNYVHPNHTGAVTSTSDGSTAIADNAITLEKISAGAVTSDKIADNAVTTSKIANGTIANQDLANMEGGRVKARLAGSGTGTPQGLTNRQMRGALRVIRGIETFASTIDWDIEDGINRTLTATGNFTLNFPSNVIAGDTATWTIVSSSGLRVITLGPGYQIPAGHSIVLSGAGKKDRLHMFFDTRFTCTVIITKDIA